jgi:hypothetical protein
MLTDGAGEYLAVCPDGHHSYLRLAGAPAFGRCAAQLDGAEGELPSRPVPCGKPAELFRLPPVPERKATR